MSDSPLDLLEKRRKAAQQAASEEDKLGDRSGWAHFGFGLTGILGGAVAATVAGAGWPTWIAVLGGIVAALGSGGATFFDFGRRSGLHWESAAALQSVADLAENKRACLDPSDTEEACAQLTVVQTRLDAARLGAARIPSAIRSEGPRTSEHTGDTGGGDSGAS